MTVFHIAVWDINLIQENFQLVNMYDSKHHLIQVSAHKCPTASCNAVA